jgi:hypothetical protein
MHTKRSTPTVRAFAALFVALSGLAGTATASPNSSATVVVTRDYGLREVGRGELRWLGLGIYEASLWSADGRFDGNVESRPLALSLGYLRKFTREELVKITAGEWERLGLGTPESRVRWAAELRRTWHDVQRGDRLTAVVVPGQGTRFYDAHRRLGTVADPAFGPAFLSIWLDPRTAVRDLRAQLLGAAR